MTDERHVAGTQAAGGVGEPENYDVYRRSGGVEARGQITGTVVEAGDDAAAVIQRALDLAGEQGGGQVLLQPGRYELRRTLRLPSRVTLQGSGRGTVLRLGPEHESGIGVLAEAVEGVVIADLTLDGRRDVVASAAGVVLDHCGDSRVRGVAAARFGKYGIWLRHNCFLCTIEDCSAADNVEANIYIDEQWRDGRGGDFVPNLVLGCTCYGGGTGIDVHHSIVLNIIGCQVFQPGKHAYHVRNRSNSVLISGCRSFECEGNAVLVDTSHEINVSSNIFCWHRGHGIEFVDVQWGTVTGNNIIDTGVQPEHEHDPSCNGIWLRGETRGVQVTGNAVFNWGGPKWPARPMAAGIVEDAAGFKNLITGNNVNTATQGVISTGQESVAATNVFHEPPYRPGAPILEHERMKAFVRRLYGADQETLTRTR